MNTSLTERMSGLLASTRGRVLAGVVVLLVVAGVIAVAVLRNDDLPEDAAFRYGERVVTTKDLDRRVEVLEALYGVQRPEGDDTGSDFDRDAAKSMATSLVLAAAARDRDIVISDKEAQTELDNLIDDQLTGGRDAFVEFLSASGISERDVLDEIRAQMATSRLIGEVTEEVPAATVEEAKAYFHEHASEMVTPAGRSLVNVVVETKADARTVARLARRDGKLAPLAATWSLDGETKDDGGRLGTVTQAQLEEGYGKAAFSAEEGEIFGPVQSTYGWNVGQVLEIVAPRRLTFKDIKDELVERLTSQKRLDAWRDYLGTLLKDADVEYADSYRPDDPTAVPTDITPASGATPSTEPTTPTTPTTPSP